MRPGAGEAREIVFVLSKLYLQHAFSSMSMLCEDVEDERGAIDNTDIFERLFQFTLVAWRKFIIEDS